MSLKASATAGSRTWVVARKQAPAYTGGGVAVTADGASAVCLCHDRLAVLDIDTGAVTRMIPGEELPVRGWRAGGARAAADAHSRVAHLYT